MTGQSRSIEDILMDRLRATQDIADANTEQLRLNQIASGLMVLDLKDDRDGVGVSLHADEQARTHTALEKNMERINQLEQRLSALDDELDAAVKKES